MSLPAQYGFVFGIANLSAFIFAPFFGRYGSKIGPKWLYNFGAFTQGVVGVSFGFLVYLQNLGPFLGLSYFLRYGVRHFHLSLSFPPLPRPIYLQTTLFESSIIKLTSI